MGVDYFSQFLSGIKLYESSPLLDWNVGTAPPNQTYVRYGGIADRDFLLVARLYFKDQFGTTRG